MVHLPVDISIRLCRKFAHVTCVTSKLNGGDNSYLRVTSQGISRYNIEPIQAILHQTQHYKGYSTLTSP